jgi:hypothetical protein
VQPVWNGVYALTGVAPMPVIAFWIEPPPSAEAVLSPPADSLTH